TGANTFVVASGLNGQGTSVTLNSTANISARLFTANFLHGGSPITGTVSIGDTTDAASITGFTGGVTAASNQAGTQRVALPDAAAVDTSISVFEIVDPRVCLPADQREDEEKGCAKSGGN
ncbi:MAG: hypothetical protein NTZ79_00770, partial [Proteobacteria bacterium]|nr:hypothetical protein [Pseudomonadota bacterium]